MKKNTLNHLAIIMDGNGRWAKIRNHKRIFGHVRGAKVAAQIVQACSDIGFSYLTLFAFSVENKLRPIEEIENLTKLFCKILKEQSHLFKDSNIRFHILGDITFFSKKIQILVKKLEQETKDHTGLNLILALNYSGRQEILDSVKKFINDSEKGLISKKDLNEKTFSSFLPSFSFPDPDLIIRTGGETRLSNFYLWQAAYSELYFTKTLWPDFDGDILRDILSCFFKKERRFGSISNF